MNKIITIIWNMLINAYLKDIREIFIQGLQKEYFISLIIFSLAMSEQLSFPYMPSRFLLNYDSFTSVQK